MSEKPTARETISDCLAHATALVGDHVGTVKAGPLAGVFEKWATIEIAKMIAADERSRRRAKIEYWQRMPAIHAGTHIASVNALRR